MHVVHIADYIHMLKIEKIIKKRMIKLIAEAMIFHIEYF